MLEQMLLQEEENVMIELDDEFNEFGDDDLDYLYDEFGDDE